MVSRINYPFLLLLLHRKLEQDTLFPEALMVYLIQKKKALKLQIDFNIIFSTHSISAKFPPLEQDI